MNFDTNSNRGILWVALIFSAVSALFAGLFLPMPRWIWMWLLVGSLWAGFKVMTFLSAGGIREIRLFFFLWPGMEVQPFAHGRETQRQKDCVFPIGALVFLLGGLVALTVLVPNLENNTARGWLGMISLLCFLHFGGFAILAWLWQQAGVPVKPIMKAPWAARDLAEFWGPRWNRAFSDWARVWVFRPLVKRFGVAGGTMAGFFTSGVAHEFVVSLPAGGGFGLPTVYFLFQGLALMGQKRFPAWKGRVVTVGAVLLPSPLLFHLPFCRNVMTPMVEAILKTIQLI